MNTNEPMLQVTFDGDAPLEPISLTEWMAYNSDGLNVAEIAEVSDLGIGGYIIFGGGAVPVSRVERIK